MDVHRCDRLEPGRIAPDLRRGAVATLGVFDGVHLGHRHLLGRLLEHARARNLPAVVLTFAIHPVVVVKGLPPRTITSLPHRLRLFAEIGLDACVVLPFDESVRQLAAEAFARTLFVDMLGLRGLVLGRDARIGRDRKGDLDFLRGFCGGNDIELVVVDDFRFSEHRISSTRVRAAIADGDLDRAAAMLGRGVSMLGTVVEGDGRGRTLGFPTANLDLHHEIRPPNGVYAIVARWNGDRRGGVLNIGTRPTFGPDGDVRVEAHLFDFDGDLYGKDVEVTLVRRLRGERSFASKDELVAQIRADAAAARQALAELPAT